MRTFWYPWLFIGLLVFLSPSFTSAQPIPYSETVYSEDFEQGWGFWYPSNGSWDIGQPTAGPDAAHGGESCAGTNLDGNYAAGTDSRLVSPAIDLTAHAAGDPLWLEFLHWHSLSAGDLGYVEYSTDLVTWSAIGDTLAVAGQGWSRHVMDVGELGGQTVYLGFHLLDDAGSGQSYGWYLDDIAIQLGDCGDGAPALPCDWSDGWQCWSTDNGLWEVGVPGAGPASAYSDTMCVGTRLSGAYPATADSRLISPSLVMPAVAGGDERVWFAFHYWQSMATADSCYVEVRLQDGDWERVGGAITGVGSLWSHAVTDLTGYAGQTVQLAVHFRDDGSGTGNGHGIFLDDLEIFVGSTAPWTVPQGFEVGWGDWSAEGGVWQVGDPTSGPQEPAAGLACAATRLDGNYPLHADARLVSPPVTLAADGDRLYLSFWHWFSVWSGDVARVEMRVEGGDWEVISGNFVQSSARWTRRLIEVTPYIGQTVQFGFHLDDDSATSGWPDYNPYITSGWYIDEVGLVEDPVEPVIPTGFEDGMTGWYADNGTWEIGDPTSGPGAPHGGAACAATVLDGNYPLHCDSRLVSAPVTVPANKSYNEQYLSFWSWFSVYGGDRAVVEIQTDGGAWVELSENFDQSGGAWTRCMVDVSDYQGQTVRFAFHLDDDGATSGWPDYNPYVTRGWYIDDLAFVDQPSEGWLPEDFAHGLGDWYVTNGTWEVGVPTAGPGAAHSGETCAGTILAGNYPLHCDTRLVSPYVTLATPEAGSRLLLSFWHWFSIYGGDLTSVEIRTADGEWEVISENFDQTGGAWTRHVIDLTDYAGQHAQLCFHLDDDSATSGWPDYNPYVSRGWYVDDIAIDVVPIQSWSDEGFEGGIGHWFASRGTWQVGAPGNGPGRALRGGQCAATLLDASYPLHCDSRLVSPPLPLPAAPDDGGLWLSFWHWFNIYNANDVARVDIRPLGGEWTPLGTPYWNHCADWTRVLLDLRDWVGQTVEISFLIDDDSATSGWPDYNPYIAQGWYIDAIEILEGTYDLPAGGSFETSAWAHAPDLGGWHVDNGVWEFGAPSGGPEDVSEGQYCAGTRLDGSYPLRADSRLISPWIELNPTPMSGQIWFSFHHWLRLYHASDTARVEWRTAGGDWQVLTDIATTSTDWSEMLVDLSDQAGQEIQLAFHLIDDGATTGWPDYNPYITWGWYIDQPAIVEGPLIFNNPDDLEHGTRGWHADNGVWQLGTPTAGPDAAHSGERCYGTRLDGNYGRYADSRLITSPVTLPATSQLRWWQWLGFADGDTGFVEVSVAGGPWEVLGAYTTSGDWAPGVIPTLAAFGGQSVRFGFRLADNGDGSQGAGWYIDDLQVVGAPTERPDAPTFLRIDYSADPPLLTWENPPGDHQWISIYSSIDEEFVPQLGHRVALVQGTSFADAGNPGWRRNYRIAAVNADLQESITVGVIEIVGTDPADTPAVATSLQPPFPNPFNPTTTIRYTVAKAGPVDLAVYDIRGRRVVTLLSGDQAQGSYEVRFDGSPLASGVYFCRLVTNDGEEVQKLALVK